LCGEIIDPPPRVREWQARAPPATTVIQIVSSEMDYRAQEGRTGKTAHRDGRRSYKGSLPVLEVVLVLVAAPTIVVLPRWTERVALLTEGIWRMR
jgi:hypothetical protein